MNDENGSAHPTHQGTSMTHDQEAGYIRNCEISTRADDGPPAFFRHPDGRFTVCLDGYLIAPLESVRAAQVSAEPAQAQPQAEPADWRQFDTSCVICPACAHQFRAIPEDVQRLMIGAGFEPPFISAPAAQPVAPAPASTNGIHGRGSIQETARGASDPHPVAPAPAHPAAQVPVPVAYWIPKAEQFCFAPQSGGRPFAKAWEPLYDTPQPPVQAVPLRWKLVPIEPTKEMCAAAVRFANGDAVYKNVAAGALEIEEGIYGEAYAAMLAAAPTPGAKLK